MWKNTNILLSVDNCLYVGYLFIYLFNYLFIFAISFGKFFLWTFFRVKRFLHCIFTVACETIPVNYLLETDRVYMFVCVCVRVCACLRACVFTCTDKF